MIFILFVCVSDTDEHREAEEHCGPKLPAPIEQSKGQGVNEVEATEELQMCLQLENTSPSFRIPVAEENQQRGESGHVPLPGGQRQKWLSPDPLRGHGQADPCEREHADGQKGVSVSVTKGIHSL